MLQEIIVYVKLSTAENHMSIFNSNLFPQGNPRLLVDWQRMYMTMYRKVELLKTRFLLSETYTTTSFTFIRTLLDRISEDYFLGDNELEVYFQHIQPEALTIERMIDPLSSGYRNKNVFFRNTKVDEYIIPTSGIIGIGKIDILDDWDDWIDVKPVRILNHNSLEFIADFVDGVIKFSPAHIPDFATIGIDIAALLTKYIKYCKDEGKSLLTADKNEFIKTHVIAHLYDDLLDTWVMNVIDKAIDKELTPDELTEISRLNEFIGLSTLRSGLQELYDLIERYSNNRVPLGSFLATKFFGEDSLHTLLKNHDTIYTVDVGNRYIAFDLLKSMTLVHALVNLLSVQKGRKLHSGIQMNIRIISEQIERSRWKTHIKDPNLVSYIGEIVEHVLLLD